MNKFLLYLLFASLFTILKSQKSNQDLVNILSYQQVIDLAKLQSPAALSTETEKENRYWQWKAFNARYLPSVELTSEIPGYNNTNIPVIQEDGTKRFASVNQSSSNVAMAINQVISPTGGRIFLDTDLEYYYDFNEQRDEFNYSPVAIGLRQPLFQYNGYKWDKKIESLKYKESLRRYFLDMEQISLNATRHYFNLMLSQIELDIAELNLKNNDTIFKIAQGRYDLGKIAENELLQIELQYLKSRQNVDQAKIEIKNRQLALKNYIGLKDEREIILLVPDVLLNFEVDYELALHKALENRPEVLMYDRQLLEGQRALKRAKGENGFNADLWMKYGLTSKSEQFAGITDNIGDQNILNISMSIPILDWGRSKAEINTAEANKRLIEYNVEQDRITFEEEIFAQVNSFLMQKQQVELAKRSDQIAQKRYEVTKNRYLIGNITITDMNIATQEKDLAKSAYINALRDYWILYFTLRKLTLYDFVLKQDIIE